MSISPPPPLPGGYKVGEKVFYTGQSFSFEYDGKTLDRVYGEQGEVTGPATVESHKGKGVTAVFSGDSRQCYLTQVRRLRAASAASPSPAAPHTRRCPHAPRASPRQPLPRRASPHCTSSRSRRGPLPGCGRDGGRGRGAGMVLAGRFGGGGRALYTFLLLTAGGCVCAQVSRDAPQPLPRKAAQA